MEIMDDTHVRINYKNDDINFFVQEYESTEAMLEDMNLLMKSIQQRKVIFMLAKTGKSVKGRTAVTHGPNAVKGTTHAEAQ